MEAAVKKLFERYESLFNRALQGETDMEAIGSLYASDVIGASPLGVMCSRNDDGFLQFMEQGYGHYRAIGTKEMRLRDVAITPIDEHHCLSRVAWAAVYAREGRPDAVIDFDINYLVQKLEGEAKVFGWITGDEQALLREHGIG